MNGLSRTDAMVRYRGRKPTVGRLVAEVAVALIALTIVVGSAVALPLLLSRSYPIGLTAMVVIASILMLAFSSRHRRRRRL